MKKFLLCIMIFSFTLNILLFMDKINTEMMLIEYDYTVGEYSEDYDFKSYNEDGTEANEDGTESSEKDNKTTKDKTIKDNKHTASYCQICGDVMGEYDFTSNIVCDLCIEAN